MNLYLDDDRNAFYADLYILVETVRKMVEYHAFSDPPVVGLDQVQSALMCFEPWMEKEFG